MNYTPLENRYDKMIYRYCGNSGLLLPVISLGLWHNFGEADDFDEATKMIKYAFDSGVTYFDLANNYGPPPGTAERNFGKIMKNNFKSYRDEMIIASKAGHLMWPGPYGDGSSRKNLLASVDQSLHRTGLDYFDIFYSHRYDGVTPVEETVQTLIDIVKQGKALYIGLSKYPADKVERAYRMFQENGVLCLVNQDRYNLFERDVEKEKLFVADKYGVGFVAFSPLAQGILTDKYLNEIPRNSRASKSTGFLQIEQITECKIKVASELNNLALRRNQSLAQMALSWILKDKRISSVIIGTSSVEQLKNNLQAINKLDFTFEELEEIENVLLALKNN